MPGFLLDTNIYIRAIRDPDARAELASWLRKAGPHVHQHAVVIAEILVGARDERTAERWHARWVAPAERVRRVLTPGYATWLRASRIVRRLLAGGHAGDPLPPAFFNDCLLAGSAREHGFTIITLNHKDFRLIARVERGVRFVPPFP